MQNRVKGERKKYADFLENWLLHENAAHNARFHP